MKLEIRNLKLEIRASESAPAYAEIVAKLGAAAGAKEAFKSKGLVACSLLLKAFFAPAAAPL
ncbi:MAG: hypothetical protein OTI34_14770 [Lewinella sp.]|nr:hypothetical protein [Lewinella sp.]